jgi:plasmid maintenance system antidote protein VapI
MKTKKSIKQLADIIGRQPQTIYHWLHGKRRMSLSDAMKLQKATGIKIDFWMPERISENEYFQGIRPYNKNRA